MCDFGYGVSCDDLSGTIGCATIGNTGDTTNMSCRSLRNVTLSAGSAAGFCLDNTASGSLAPVGPDAGPTPDLTPPDAGVPDRALPQPDQRPPDTGTPLSGFGNLCSVQSPCPAGLICHVPAAGGRFGFCTRTCNVPGGICSGTPPGTVALCDIFSPPSSYLCHFACSIGGQSASCPGQLWCNPSEWPPGSGVKYCDPAGGSDGGGAG